MCVISVYLFGCPAPTFYQFFLGSINMFNFLKSMKMMEANKKTLGWWAFGNMGGMLKEEG